MTPATRDKLLRVGAKPVVAALAQRGVKGRAIRLPPALLGRLSPAPAGYQYVRVASDVLMLAVGTRMVTAAIADLSRF